MLLSATVYAPAALSPVARAQGAPEPRGANADAAVTSADAVDPGTEQIETDPSPNETGALDLNPGQTASADHSVNSAAMAPPVSPVRNLPVPFGVDLDLFPSVAIVGQQASRVRSGTSGLVNLRYDLAFRWTMYELDGGGGAIGGDLRGSVNLGAPNDASLSVNTGSRQGLNEMRDPYTFTLRTAWWEMHAPGDAVNFYIGKIDDTDYFDVNVAANAEATQFLSGGLNNNASIPFPDTGLGFNLEFDQDVWSIMVGGSNGVASTTDDEIFGSFQFDQAIGYAELDWNPVIDHGGEQLAGHYRFIFWGSEYESERGWGFGTSFDQALPGGVTAFLRLGWADVDVLSDSISPFDTAISGGVSIVPAGRPRDTIGVGLSWARSPLEDIGREMIFETYWRIEISDRLSVSPDLQLLWQEGEGGATVIGGLRVRYAL